MNHHFVYADYSTSFGKAHICKNCQSIYIDENQCDGEVRVFFWDKNGKPINNNNSKIIDCNDMIIRNIIQ